MAVKCGNKIEICDDEGEHRKVRCQLKTQHRKELHRYSSVKLRLSVTWSDNGTYAIGTGVPFWRSP